MSTGSREPRLASRPNSDGLGLGLGLGHPCLGLSLGGPGLDYNPACHTTQLSYFRSGMYHVFVYKCLSINNSTYCRKTFVSLIPGVCSSDESLNCQPLVSLSMLDKLDIPHMGQMCCMLLTVLSVLLSINPCECQELALEGFTYLYYLPLLKGEHNSKQVKSEIFLHAKESVLIAKYAPSIRFWS